MSIHRKLMTVCCAAVLAFGLAACGSSDDDTAADDTPTVEEQAGPTQADLDAEKMRADEAEQDLADAAAAAKSAKLRALSGAVTSFMGAAADRRAITTVATYNAGTGRFTVTPMPALTPVAPALSAGDAPENAGGWSGNTWSRTLPAGGGSDMVTLYSDKGIRNGPPFSRLTTLGADARRLAVAGGDATTENADARRIAGEDFASSGTKNHLPTGVSLGPTNPIMVEGTYAGVSGTYLCVAGTECTSSPGPMGGVTLAGAGAMWWFEPDDRAALTEPEDFRYFGWWLQENAVGQLTVGTFAGNSDAAATALTGLDTLNGTASYAGGAAGKATLAPALGQITGGHWTADASLTANFTRNNISGTIDNFMVDGEETDWSVALNAAVIGADGDIMGDAATTNPGNTRWSIGGVGARPGGSWTGQFHDAAPATAPDNGTPRQVTGQFRATYNGAGQMIGAFGAHKE